MSGLPTPEPRTDGRASSSLPTPRATRGGSSTETMALLPTPMTTDAKVASAGDTNRKSPPLRLLQVATPFYLPAAAPVPAVPAEPGCRYCKTALTDDQERRWGICEHCYDAGRQG